jgi:predicted PurR-regulated permease PerM
MSRPPLIGSSSWTVRRVVLGTITVLAIACAGWLVYRFRAVWVTLLVAIVLASSVQPAMQWLRRRGLSRTLAALVIHAVILTFAVGFAVLVLPMVFQQLPPIAAKLGGLYHGARAHLLASHSQIVVRLAGRLPPSLPGASGGQPETVAHGLATLSSLLRGLFLAISVPVFAFLWTVDGERTVRWLLLLAPTRRRKALREVVAAAESKMGAFVRGQLIACAAVGVMALPVYLVIGVSHAFVLALVAAALEVLSFPGTIMAATLAVLVALTQSPFKALWIIVAVVGINLVQSYVVAPRVMRGSVGVSSFVRLLAITAFGIVGGVAGVFLAIPAAAVLQLIFERTTGGQAAQAGAR